MPPGNAFQQMGQLLLMEFKPWTLMYVGAFACAVMSLVLIYVITVTGNVSYEVGIYFMVFFGFGFAAGGYLLESKHKRENPEEYILDELEEE